MYKKLFTVALLAIFVAFMASRVITGMINIANSPKTEFYFKGILCGSEQELRDSKFSFKTYDENMKEIRTEEAKVFLKNNFMVNYQPNERYVKVYVTYSKDRKIKKGVKASIKPAMLPGVVDVAVLEPDGALDLKYMKTEQVYFCLNHFYVKKK